MKTAIFLCSYDGISSMYCGVGTITSTFIYSFNQIRKNLQKELGIDIDLFLISPVLNKKYIGYDSILEQNMKDLISKNGGKILLVPNGTKNFDQYGSPTNREIVSHESAKVIAKFSKGYDKIIGIYCDTPFMKIPFYLNKQLPQKAYNIRHYLWLHSDVYIHESGLNTSRLSREKECINYTCKEKNTYIIDVNKFFRKNLDSHYTIPKRKWIPLRNGLFLKNEKYNAFSQKAILTKLKEYNIPIDKKIIFGMARAIKYKGLEQLIMAYSKLKCSDTHLVIIAAPYVKNGGNVKELKNLIKKLKIKSYTIIFNFDFSLPQYLYQWENTKIVCQLSLAEPFGLVPEEVRVCARNHGAIILCSNRDGFLEQITNGKDGFLVDPLNLGEIQKYFNLILNSTNDFCKKINKAGYSRVLKYYDYEKNLSMFLKKILTHNNQSTQ